MTAARRFSRPLAVALAAGVLAALAAATVAIASSSSEPASASAEPAPLLAPSPESYVLDREMNRIDGTPERLDAYKGKVLVLVNTASRCGLTPQYRGLEELYQKHKDRGLVILGFPANNFAGQEPGTNKEIAEFCSRDYGVTFPMFEKISVKGDDAHPLYKQIDALPDPTGQEPSWNFTKYLVDRQGHVVARFDPRTKPGDETFIATIEALLAAE